MIRTLAKDIYYKEDLLNTVKFLVVILKILLIVKKNLKPNI